MILSLCLNDFRVLYPHHRSGGGSVRALLIKAGTFDSSNSFASKHGERKLTDHGLMLYTDTDSLIYEITGVDMYSVMRRDIHEFDTSNYPETNPFNMPRANKKIVGLMKDECNGEIMLEFVGLRSKMYSVKVQNQKPIKKAKGVKNSVVKATICFDDYIKCLRENVIITRKQRNTGLGVTTSTLRKREKLLSVLTMTSTVYSQALQIRCPGVITEQKWWWWWKSEPIRMKLLEWGNASRRIPQIYPYITRWCASRSSFEQSTL